MVQGKIVNERTGLMECPECKGTWSPQIKEGGNFYRGSQQCPHCK